MTTFLAFLSLTFLIIAIGDFFAGAWLWALFFFLVFCVLIYIFGLTPEGKRLAKETEENNKQKQLEQERAKRKEELAIQELKSRFELLVHNPNDSESLSFVLTELDKRDKQNLVLLIDDLIIPLLQIKSLDTKVRGVVFDCIKKAIAPIGVKRSEKSALFYHVALDILEDNSDHSPLKQYVLEV
ncbi:hypothetical protein [Nodosilinea nodulosa]|uniref:hypothetical protein n=1 Tax=Nodosilinea nodulosa TaxID=416001 RepID=UPI0012D83368|nr:hypothetical protein [Nodosilinea nodulosa]